MSTVLEQRGAGAEPSRGVRLGAAVRLVGRPGPAAGECLNETHQGGGDALGLSAEQGTGLTLPLLSHSRIDPEGVRQTSPFEFSHITSSWGITFIHLV